MRTSTTRLLPVILLALMFVWAPSLAAQDTQKPYTKGDAVADHDIEHWVNPPAWSEFSDFKGDVVVFKKWSNG